VQLNQLNRAIDATFHDLTPLQKLAQVYLSFSDASMAKALNAGELEEVNYNGEEVSE
jgi:hypothetical protein